MAKKQYEYSMKLNTKDFLTGLQNAKLEAEKFDTLMSTIGDRGNLNELIEQFMKLDDLISTLRHHSDEMLSELGDSIKGGYMTSIDQAFKKMSELMTISKNIFAGLGDINIQDKNAPKQLAQYAEQLNTLFKNVGINQKIDLELFDKKSVEEQFKMVLESSKWLNGQIQVVLGDIDFSGFENSFKNAGKLVENAVHGAAEPIKQFSAEVQAEIDNLEQEISRLSGLKEELSTVLQAGEAYDNFEPIKLDIEETEEFVKRSIEEYKKLKQAAEDLLDSGEAYSGDTYSEEYYSNLLKRTKVLLQLEAIRSYGGADGAEKGLATREVSNLVDNDLDNVLSELREESENINNTISQVMSNKQNALNVIKEAGDVDVTQDGSKIEDSTKKMQGYGSAIENIGEHAITATEYINGMANAIRNLFDVASKSSELEYKILMGRSASINAEDLKTAIIRQHSGLSKVSAIIGDKDILTLDLAKVKAEDAAAALKKVDEIASKSKLKTVSADQLNNILKDINPEYGDIARRWDPSQFEDLATYLFEIKTNGEQALDPLSKFKNLLTAITGGKIDLSKYEKLFENFSVGDASKIFNQIMKSENFTEDGKVLKVSNTQKGSINDIIQDLERQKIKYQELRDEAKVTYADIRAEVDKYLATGNRSFFEKFFDKESLNSLYGSFADVEDNLISIDQLTNRIASDFGIDPSEFVAMSNSMKQVGDIAKDEHDEVVQENEALKEKNRLLEEEAVKQQELLDTTKIQRDAVEEALKQEVAANSEAEVLVEQEKGRANFLELQNEELRKQLELEGQITAQNKQIEEANKEPEYFNTPTGQLAMFDGMSGELQKAEENGKKLKDTIQEIAILDGQISFDDLAAAENKAITGVDKQNAELDKKLELQKQIAAQINSYEELCKVVQRYNELVLKGHTEGQTLSSKEQAEIAAIQDRLAATKGVLDDPDRYVDYSISMSRMAGILGEYSVDRLAEYLGVEIPQATEKAEEAVKEVVQAQERLDNSHKNNASAINKTTEALQKQDAAIDEATQSQKQLNAAQNQQSKQSVQPTGALGGTSQVEQLPGAVDKVTTAVRQKTEAFVNEGKVVGQVIGKEISGLGHLEKELKEVMSAVQGKTKAFIDEGTTVGQVVGKEVAALKHLEEELKEIKKDAKVNVKIKHEETTVQPKQGTTTDGQGASDTKKKQESKKTNLKIKQNVLTDYAYLSKNLDATNLVDSEQNDYKSYQEKFEKLKKLRDEINAKPIDAVTEEELTQFHVLAKEVEELGKKLDKIRKQAEQTKAEIKEVVAEPAVNNSVDKKSDSSASTSDEPPLSHNANNLEKVILDRLGVGATGNMIFDTQTVGDIEKGIVKVAGAYKDANGELKTYNFTIDRNLKITKENIGYNKTLANTYELIHKNQKKANDEAQNSSKQKIPKSDIEIALEKEKQRMHTATRNATEKYNQITNQVQSTNLSGKALTTFEKYIAKYKEFKQLQKNIDNEVVPIDDTTKAKFDVLKKEVADLAKEMFNLEKNSKKIRESVSKENKFQIDPSAANNLDLLKIKMEEFAQESNNSKIENINFDNTLKTLTYDVVKGDGFVEKMSMRLDEYSSSIIRAKIKTEETSSVFSKLSKTMVQGWTNVFRYVSSFVGFYEIINQLRKGVGYVKEIDSALTELKKVTDETDATYDKFLNTMAKTAGVVGSTVKDLTTMAADWARLGYSLEEAGKLAESTAILLNVSEFNDATEASEALISTIQAFGYAADESMRVIDILNEVNFTCLRVQ